MARRGHRGRIAVSDSDIRGLMELVRKRDATIAALEAALREIADIENQTGSCNHGSQIAKNALRASETDCGHKFLDINCPQCEARMSLPGPSE